MRRSDHDSAGRRAQRNGRNRAGGLVVGCRPSRRFKSSSVPKDPYSHNIWGVGIGPDLYIATGAKGTRWTPFIAEDPNVRVRVGTELFDLKAVPVTDDAERTRVAEAYTKKYDVKADDNWVAAGLIYRLDRRI